MTWGDALAKSPRRAPRSTAPAPMPTDTASSYGRAAIEGEAADVRATPEGSRNDRLNAAAYSLGQLVAGGVVAESDVWSALRAAAQACGLGASEADATIGSGINAGKAEPRGVPEREPRRAERSGPPPDDGWLSAEPNDAEAPDAEPRSESKPKPVFTKLGAVEIFAPLPPVPYLVEGLDFCPGPPNLVAGYGFSGKTVTLQALAIATVSGRRAWGAFSVRQGRVLHLDYEQGRRLTCERYQRLARVESLTPDEMAGLDVVCLPPLYLDTLDAEPALIRECEGYALVIVDSLRACAPHVDENSSEVRSVLDMLHRVSDKTGATFVIVHHARKPQRDAPGGARMAIRGSGALFDAAASVLVLEAQKGEPVRAIHEKARTSGRPTDDFLLTIDDVEVDGNPRGGLVCRAEAAPTREVVTEEAEASKRQQRTANLADELRDLFRREPEHQGADGIAAKLGRRVPDVRSALALLTDSGEVIVTGKSRDRRHQWSGRE